MLQGRVAVVTGSTSGIGLGIARALARDGASIMLNGFGDAAAIERLRADLAAECGVRVAYDDADMTVPAQVAGLIERTVAELGAVDILVNNAGIQYVAPVERFPLDRWDAIIAINLSSSFHSVRAALPHMRRRDWGRIVNVASAHGLVASIDKAAYVAAKHGVVGLTKVVALETAASNVTCNAICPGFVLTPLVQQQIDAVARRDGLDGGEASRRFLCEKQPSGRFVTPEAIGDLALYLCSDSAAEVRGAAISIDGGWTAQ